MAQRVKHLPAMLETRVQSLGQEDPLEKKMVTHSSTLAWKIPWTEKPVRLQSMGSQRVGHDWATSLFHFNPVTAQVSLFALAARELRTKTVACLLSRIIQNAVIWTDLSLHFLFPSCSWFPFLFFLLHHVFWWMLIIICGVESGVGKNVVQCNCHKLWHRYYYSHFIHKKWVSER